MGSITSVRTHLQRPTSGAAAALVNLLSYPPAFAKDLAAQMRPAERDKIVHAALAGSQTQLMATVARIRRRIDGSRKPSEQEMAVYRQLPVARPHQPEPPQPREKREYKAHVRTF